ncbi:unnamed protein product [Citrullus colocynthis]|uniref:Uncharacterized protein n=1 Tax=Citrullus colocynthis TaxID=252529 RepID=A0ABP0YQV4_9ROSI
MVGFSSSRLLYIHSFCYSLRKKIPINLPHFKKYSYSFKDDNIFSLTYPLKYWEKIECEMIWSQFLLQVTTQYFDIRMNLQFDLFFHSNKDCLVAKSCLDILFV